LIFGSGDRRFHSFDDYLKTGKFCVWSFFDFFPYFFQRFQSLPWLRLPNIVVIFRYLHKMNCWILENNRSLSVPSFVVWFKLSVFLYFRHASNVRSVVLHWNLRLMLGFSKIIVIIANIVTKWSLTFRQVVLYAFNFSLTMILLIVESLSHKKIFCVMLKMFNSS
jgi:hypothetical protein